MKTILLTVTLMASTAFAETKSAIFLFTDSKCSCDAIRTLVGKVAIRHSEVKLMLIDFETDKEAMAQFGAPKVPHLVIATEKKEVMKFFDLNNIKRIENIINQVVKD